MLLFSIFHLFSLSPADRQMGDRLVGTENVMERFSFHPTMRTDCSCDISLQIEGERSGVPNGTALFSWHSGKSWRVLKDIWRNIWHRVESPDLFPFVFHTFMMIMYQILDLFSSFLFGWYPERQTWKNIWLVLFQSKPRVLKAQNVF